MSRLPDRFTDSRSLQREKEAAARSPKYRQHPTVTVYLYLRMTRAEQDAINWECAAIEQAKQAGKDSA